ncbi:MAG: ATP-binding cassette domain-containing protein [Gammaproteobacteria bacterium]
MIRFDQVSLRRGAKLLFSDVNLTVHAGQCVGVTGANGIGKTSLFGLLGGELIVDSGDIHIHPDLEIASVAQEVEATDVRALDYVVAGDRGLIKARQALADAESRNDGHAVALAHDKIEQIGGYLADSRAAKLLAGLGFSEQEQRRAFSEFSGGWRMRLNLARALMCRSDLLLLDEPTNHLDLDAIIWLESWLASYQGMLLVISHDRDFLDAICTHIWHLENQAVTMYTGNYSDFEQQRSARLAGQQAAFIKQQREIAHMQKFVERFRAKATKARQAQSRLKALSRLEQIAPAHIDSPFTFGFEKPDKMPEFLVSVVKADFGYGENRVLRNVTLSIRAGDRIGLLGANGAGKSTFIKALVGELEPMTGEIESARDLKTAYFAQHQVEQLRHDETPLSYLQRLEPSASESALRKYLGGFAFSGDTAVSPIGPFSGGEKARLVLAAIIRQKPNLLLLDEPTNHLDLEMRHALSIALQEFTGALVVVSHDRHLLQSVSDTLKFIHDGVVDEFDGDLEDYARWLLRSRSEEKPAEKTHLNDTASATNSTNSHSGLSAQEKKALKRKQAQQRQRTSDLRKNISKLEKIVDEAQKELSEITDFLADNALYDPARKADLKRLLDKQANIKQKLFTAENDWMEQTEALEQATS